MRCFLQICLLILLSCEVPHDRQVQINQLDSLPFSSYLEHDTTIDILSVLDSGWIDLKQLDSSFSIDIRYATMNNFVGIRMYPCGRCILKWEVGQALLRVQQELKQKGLGLKLFDCYRPWSVQKALWQKMPDARYVTRPEKGSMHNRGAAVDLTIIDESGNELDMGTAYDFFGEEAYHTFTEHDSKVMHNRALLKSLMEAAGFKPIRTEWWHYSYQEKMFPLIDYHWPCPGEDNSWEVDVKPK